MQFLYPSFLWFLFASLIPIIIHLFNFRRYRKMIFSDIRFLKELQEESVSARKIKEWIILLLRSLAIAAMVVAFARPYIPDQKAAFVNGANHLVIYIDNSFSMGLEGKEGPLMEEAKSLARSVVSAFGNESEVILLSNQSNNLKWLSKEDALPAIDAIKPIGTAMQTNSLGTLVAQAFQNRNGNNLGFIISDFQQSGINPNALLHDSNFHWKFIPLHPQVARNIFIDTAWLSNPVLKAGRPINIPLRLRMSGGKDDEQVSVKLEVNDLQKGVQSAKVAPDGQVTLVFNFTPDQKPWQRLKFTLEDHPMVFDDQLYLTLHLTKGNRVLCINGDQGSTSIQKVYSIDKDYLLAEMNFRSIDFQQFDGSDLIILNEVESISSGLLAELNRYLNDGGQLLVIPAPNKGAAGLNDMLRTYGAPVFGSSTTEQLQVEKLNKQDPFFRDVFTSIPENPDMPLIHEHYELMRNSLVKGRPLMKLTNGDPMIWITGVGAGKLFVSAMPLGENYSSFSKHALFVPVMLKLAMGGSKTNPLYYAASTDQRVALPDEFKSAHVAHLKHDPVSYTSEIQIRNGKPILHTGAEMNTAGVFEGSVDNQKSIAFYTAFNFGRDESYLKYNIPADSASNDLSLEGLSSEQLMMALGNAVNGTALWRYFLILALLFLAGEMLLLKLK